MSRDPLGLFDDPEADDELEEAEHDDADRPNAAEVYLASCGKPDKRPRCSAPDCGALAPRTCTFALRGRLEGTTCGRRLCPAHAGDASLCPPHARLTGAPTP